MGAELVLSVGAPSIRALSPPDYSSSGATSHTRTTAQDHCEKQQNGSTRGESHPTTIAMLPDNVLLEVFDFYRSDHHYARGPVWNWRLLVHVCQTWRQIVLASPHRLDLKIHCTYGTPVRKNLRIWPAFPIIIRYGDPWAAITPNDEDNIISALEHRDRVCDVELSAIVWGSRLEKFVTVMQEPFQVLKRLYICSEYIRSGNSRPGFGPPVLPAKFLGGSAPCLQEIILSGILYPALPMLLLSASDLVTLDLLDIPPTGYFSPEAMVACLATLPRLDSFTIIFRSDTSRPDRADRIRPSLMTRTVLPALTTFQFIGASEYLEDLVTQIDSPQLNQISIEYLRLVDYQVTQLSEFIDRSVSPKLTLSRGANVLFSSRSASFSVYPHINRPSWDWRPPKARVLCKGVNWRVLDLAQLLSHFPTPLSNVVHLDLGARVEVNRPLEDMSDIDWLRLLHQFSAVQTLGLYNEPAEHVALTLEDISGELVAEVLPSLDLVCIVDQPASSIEQFIAAREHSGYPVTVFDTETEFDKRLESYISKKH
ncbi:hypothetical protein EDB89DRAFT_2070510 [Lactarius sanguifluus]|nr:hypothetical protein EDB89DRAFT_2070510 [Lactarius sanguifluus]